VTNRKHFEKVIHPRLLYVNLHLRDIQGIGSLLISASSKTPLRLSHEERNNASHNNVNGGAANQVTQASHI